MGGSIPTLSQLACKTFFSSFLSARCTPTQTWMNAKPSERAIVHFSRSIKCWSFLFSLDNNLLLLGLTSAVHCATPDSTKLGMFDKERRPRFFAFCSFIPRRVGRRAPSESRQMIQPQMGFGCWVLILLTACKGASSAFAGQRWSGLSALTSSLIVWAWFASRTWAWASMGIAQRGSNRSKVMMWKKGKDSGKRDANYLICQGHQDPIESKGPPPDRRQMHALNGWLKFLWGLEMGMCSDRKPT